MDINETVEIKIPFKRKACQVYEGGCCRQVTYIQYSRISGRMVDKWMLL